MAGIRERVFLPVGDGSQHEAPLQRVRARIREIHEERVGLTADGWPRERLSYGNVELGMGLEHGENVLLNEGGPAQVLLGDGRVERVRGPRRAVRNVPLKDYHGRSLPEVQLHVLAAQGTRTRQREHAVQRARGVGQQQQVPVSADDVRAVAPRGGGGGGWRALDLKVVVRIVERHAETGEAQGAREAGGQLDLVRHGLLGAGRRLGEAEAGVQHGAGSPRGRPEVVQHGAWQARQAGVLRLVQSGEEVVARAVEGGTPGARERQDVKGGAQVVLGQAKVPSAGGGALQNRLEDIVPLFPLVALRNAVEEVPGHAVVARAEVLLRDAGRE
mmetsp:Transcript_33859/g.95289  ORF Transcript_33859/g.95289 Transcript_33859/m.95289 type:complete len:330 (+) Transcript_33859:1131-2120(+)